MNKNSKLTVHTFVEKDTKLICATSYNRWLTKGKEYVTVGNAFRSRMGGYGVTVINDIGEEEPTDVTNFTLAEE